MLLLFDLDELKEEMKKKSIEVFASGGLSATFESSHPTFCQLDSSGKKNNCENCLDLKY